jgi:CRP-like cAMP-binding protein
MSNGTPELLKGLAEADVESTLALGSRISLAGGDQLFSLGANADCLYLIERGCINLTLPMQLRGKEQDVLVEERKVGQTVGWSALTPPYRFTLRASAPVATEVIALPRLALSDYFSRHPQVAYQISLNLAAVIGQRLQLFQAMWLREMERMLELRCA